MIAVDPDAFADRFTATHGNAKLAPLFDFTGFTVHHFPPIREDQLLAALQKNMTPHTAGCVRWGGNCNATANMTYPDRLRPDELPVIQHHRSPITGDPHYANWYRFTEKGRSRRGRGRLRGHRLAGGFADFRARKFLIRGTGGTRDQMKRVNGNSQLNREQIELAFKEAT